MEKKMTQPSRREIKTTDLPAILDGTPVFETSPEAPYPKLDEWKTDHNGGGSARL